MWLKIEILRQLLTKDSNVNEIGNVLVTLWRVRLTTVAGQTQQRILSVLLS
jgi:hypothetical protein